MLIYLEAGALDLMTDLLHNLQYKTMDYGFHMTITECDEVVSKEMEIMVKEKGCFSYIFYLYCMDFILPWTLVSTSWMLSLAHFQIFLERIDLIP